MDIKLIAFDLDGTFLDREKHIPEENRRAIERAAANGAYIVPATGRVYDGIPEEIRGFPFMHYYLTSNGAHVYDAVENKVVAKAEISVEDSIELLQYADAHDLAYDCYLDNWGYMTASMLYRAEEFVTDPGILKLVTGLRTPVDELKSFLIEKASPVQKLQLYFTDMQERQRQLECLPTIFPKLNISSSLPFNIEINSAAASKGQALSSLCSMLGISRENVIAFGDGTNDADMLEYAGLGVAMANAEACVKAKADYITLSNNDAGVAFALKRFMENC